MSKPRRAVWFCLGTAAGGLGVAAVFGASEKGDFGGALGYAIGVGVVVLLGAIILTLGLALLVLTGRVLVNQVGKASPRVGAVFRSAALVARAASDEEFRKRLTDTAKQYEEQPR